MLNSTPLIKENVGEVLTSETVGFSRIPEQARKMSVEKGFSLNILVLGRRGSGTRTLINNLFLSPILSNDRPNALTTTCAQVTENGVCLNVRISTCHELDEDNMIKFIKSTNFNYFEAQEGLMEDTGDLRVHVCLFVLPTDTLLPDELRLMGNIGQYTNLIPVIGKADAYMQDELVERKARIMEQLNENDVKMFMPEELDGENNTATLPMAVTASESLFKINGQTKRGRLYKWGFVDVNDTTCNDFLYLRKMLIGTHLEEIKRSFETKFYEEFRIEQLRIEEKKLMIMKYRGEKLLEAFEEWKNSNGKCDKLTAVKTPDNENIKEITIYDE